MHLYEYWVSVFYYFCLKKKKKNLHPARDSNSIPQRYLVPCLASLSIAPHSILASVELKLLLNSLIYSLTCIVYIHDVFCISIYNNYMSILFLWKFLFEN